MISKFRNDGYKDRLGNYEFGYVFNFSGGRDFRRMTILKSKLVIY